MSQQLTGVLANSGSARDIQIAVDEAAAQGISNIHIPEGIFDLVEVGEPWMGVTVNLNDFPAGIGFFGAPTQRTSGLPEPSRGMSPNDQVVEWKTVLRMPFDVDVDFGWFFKVDGDNIQPFRFSDIKLVGYQSIAPGNKNWHYGICMENVPSFRIDHCLFEHTTGGAIWSIGCRGVIDHSRLVNHYGAVKWAHAECDVLYGIMIYGKDVWVTDIADVLGKDTDQTVFIEDCYLSRWRHCYSGAKSAHIVFRHNTVEYDSIVGSLDAHGWRAYYLSTRAMEIYNNEIIDPVLNGQPNYDSMIPSNGTQGYGVFWRGGGGVAFNNLFRNYYTGISLSLEGPDAPEQYRIHDVWIWDNTWENIGWRPVDTDGTMIENVDYFLRAPTLAEDGFEYTPYPYPKVAPLIPPIDLIAAGGLAVVDAALIVYYLLKRFNII